MSLSSEKLLKGIISFLDTQYGEIPWWPGSTEEVMIGAVLTQQTRWTNVEVALGRMNEYGLCSLAAIYRSDDSDIESAIRCTGFYRVKTKRLKTLASFVIDNYCDVNSMQAVTTSILRKELLCVNGIGAETADSILCYALNRRSYVIDAYTERICGCAGITEKKGLLKSLFESVLPEDNQAYRLCHAWFVEYAKEYCGNRRCGECMIKNLK